MKYKVEILYESFEKPDWVSILKQLKDEGKEGFPLVYGRHTDRDRGWTLFTPDDVDRAHERTLIAGVWFYIFLSRSLIFTLKLRKGCVLYILSLKQVPT